MRSLSRLSALLVTLTAPFWVLAQGNAPSWLLETLNGSGKMNTVIIVVGIILVGLFAWLFALDRRIKKLEEK